MDITNFIPKNHIDELKSLHEKYNMYLPAVFFSLGFIIDIFTLGEIDDLSNILMQAFYLTFGAFVLAIEYMEITEAQISNSILRKVFNYRDDIFHFLLGSLLSAFTLFYFKSSSFANSFIFLTLIATLLVLNEIEIFQKLGSLIRTVLFTLCFVTYLVYIIPVISGQSGTFIFFISTGIAAIFATLTFLLLTKRNQDRIGNIKTLLIPQIAVVAVVIMFYLLKIFPPIPLSIKSISIYHDLKKANGTYITSHLNPWWKFWNKGDQNFMAREGDKVVVFTKIFSPAGFEGKIYLNWLKDTDDGLVSSDRIPLSITGGRSEGFRGFAYKQNYTYGDWQIRVETQNGLEIGRIKFEITKDESKSKRKFIKIIH